MFLRRLVLVVRKLARPAPERAVHGVHPPHEVRRILARERARADRTGTCLSLVAFDPRCPEDGRTTAALLAGILRARLRATDEFGWLDGRRIGVVMPTTPAMGAWKLVDDVCRVFPEDVPPPVGTVYSYPPAGSCRPEAPGQDGEDAAPGKPALGLEVFFLQPLPLWKRAVDVTGALAGMVLLLPFFAAIAAAVKLSSRGPVLFKQLRSGRGGEPFVMYKFRTMVVDAEARKSSLLSLNEQDGPAFKLRDDPRITALGRFLRQSSLDELPQLWNVLLGHMSLVGPRPLPCEETEACEGWQRQRLDVQPGLTCIWQVRGRGGVDFADWIRMDLEYIRSQSPLQDLKLLVLTVPAVLLRRGAH